MEHILAKQNRNILEQFAWANVLLAFDFDGTLAPIVSDPKRAALRLTTRRILEAATRLYPCVVISSRPRADLLGRLAGIGFINVIGSYSVEPSKSARRLADVVRGWKSRLGRELGSFRGVEVEDKVFSLAIHYRKSRQKKRTRAAILEAVAALEAARVIRGKQVINVLPSGAPHKGIVLEHERLNQRCDTALYVGDDESDEDVFTLDQPGMLVSIRVGRRRSSAARYYLRSQRELDRLIAVLVSLREQDTRRRWFE
jgi:trehalose 6-phosphate phosphatase